MWYTNNIRWIGKQSPDLFRVSYPPDCLGITDTDKSRNTINQKIEEPLDVIEMHFDGIDRSLDRLQMMLWIATILVVVAGIVNWMYVLKLWR